MPVLSARGRFLSRHFPAGWIGTDLHGCRPRVGTYDEYDLDLLPPLPSDAFDDSFGWLRREPPRSHPSASNVSNQWKRRVDDWSRELSSSCATLKVYLPNHFFTFMSEPELLFRLRSPTGCEFVHRPDLIPCRAVCSGHLVQFCSDSQDCCHWYLHIDSEQNCTVVAGDVPEGPDEQDLWREDPRLVLCARSFTAFVYRLWIENEIWFRRAKRDAPLSSDMLAYVRFYLPDGT